MSTRRPDDAMEFLAQLTNERERLSRLAHLIARKQSVLRECCTQLRLGVDPELVATAIIRECCDELAELEP